VDGRGEKGDGGGKIQDGSVILRETIGWTLGESYAGPAWHGPTVREVLRGLTAAQAIRRPAPGRNTVWELVLHLAYGRHLMLRRMNPTSSGGRFPYPLRRAWWPRAPAVRTERAWRADLALLDEYHARLLKAVADASDAALRRKRGRNRRTIAQELIGLALHDTYHAGQIRLIARMGRTGRRATPKIQAAESRGLKGDRGNAARVRS
jgi:uncharacterized damage-inducible protein DinB